MEMFKRIFSRSKPETVTKSIRITTDMEIALEALAKDAGESLNAYVVLVLDQYLQVQMEKGLVQPPKDLIKDKPIAS